MLSARRTTNALKGKIGRSCTITHEEMSRAAGVKKPNENQKAKAIWKMKAAKDRERTFTTQDERQHSGKK